MEDREIRMHKVEGNTKIQLFGVLDGHGGELVVEESKDFIQKYFQEQVKGKENIQIDT